MDAIKQERGKQDQLTEKQKQWLVKNLFKLLDEVVNHPEISLSKPFPTELLEKAIQRSLDSAEKKFVSRVWSELGEIGEV